MAKRLQQRKDVIIIIGCTVWKDSSKEQVKGIVNDV